MKIRVEDEELFGSTCPISIYILFNWNRFFLFLLSSTTRKDNLVLLLIFFTSSALSSQSLKRLELKMMLFYYKKFWSLFIYIYIFELRDYHKILVSLDLLCVLLLCYLLMGSIINCSSAILIKTFFMFGVTLFTCIQCHVKLSRQCSYSLFFFGT